MNCRIALFNLVIIGGLFFSLAALFAQVPQLINYQGMLVNPANGEKLDGSYSMTFSIYSTETGGTALWTEMQTVVVDDGLFNVLLGSTTAIPFNLFDETARYLGVKVGSDPEMTPRKRLVSVGYAFKANDADHFAGKDTADFVQTGQANSISTAMILDGAVTTAKISPAVVSSVDGVTNDGGDVDLVAGSNVTITHNDEDNTITIAATPGGGGDNLGDHTATQNVKLNNHWLSGDGDSEGVFVKGDGNVGIGLNTPAYKLDVLGDINTSYPGYAGKSLRLFSSSDQRVIATNDLTFRYADAGGNGLVKFVENGHERLTIKNGGNVGIGTTTPAQKLDVNGTVQMTGLKLPTGAGSGKVLTSDASGNGSWQTGGGAGDNLGNHTATQNIKLNNHWLSGDGGNEGVYVNAEGKVGIGTSSLHSAQLRVASNSDCAGFFTADELNYGGSVLHVELTGDFNPGMYPEEPYAIYAKCTPDQTTWGGGGYFEGNSIGVMAETIRSDSYALYGLASEGGEGVVGEAYGDCYSNFGVSGFADQGQFNCSISGYAGYHGVENWAGYFGGNVRITGSLNPSSTVSQIDHPLDPANKYLNQSMVSSTDMLNIYNGNVILDEAGEAIVELPEWFEAYNKDFRYQLTCIGGFAQVYIADEISNNRFKIAGGKSGMKISWQVSGVRKDAYALAHPVEVEKEKNDRERGKYLHPVELGQPESLGIDYENHQRMEENDKRMLERHNQNEIKK